MFELANLNTPHPCHDYLEPFPSSCTNALHIFINGTSRLSALAKRNFDTYSEATRDIGICKYTAEQSVSSYIVYSDHTGLNFGMCNITYFVYASSQVSGEIVRMSLCCSRQPPPPQKKKQTQKNNNKKTTTNKQRRSFEGIFWIRP